MSRDDLAEALAAAGAGVRADELADEVVSWLAAAPSPEVREGLARAGDAAAAVHGLGRLLAAAAPPVRPGRAGLLLRLLGGSPVLAATLTAEGRAWPERFQEVLDVAARDRAWHVAALEAAGAVRARDRAALQATLRRHRQREFVRIGGRDLLGLASIDETVREITALAEGAIEAAVTSVRARLADEWGDAVIDGRPAGFAVLGMGKLGGEELNYSSDVDLVYVYERDGELAGGRTLREFFSRLAEEVTRALGEVTAEGFCFRVDLRLRPGGGEGPVAVSLPAALAYYETWGQTWERAVWLKARPVAGTLTLGDALNEELRPFVHRRFLDFATLEDLKHMKSRVDASLRGPDAAARDVKLGRGGIREIEFFVQAQQLVHGGKDPRLHVRGTLPALGALGAAGYVEPALADRLAVAYRFLRNVEHKLQMVHERRTQLLPRAASETAALARRLGYAGPAAADAFLADHAAHTGAVHDAFDALFHGAEGERRREERPELRALVQDLEQEERAFFELARLGFRDVEGAYRDLRLLRDGPPHAPASARRQRALELLAPALLAEVAASAAPDRALHHVATFITGIGARTSYLHLLLENPGVLRLLVRLFATSEFLSEFFLRHPELLDNLVRVDLVRVRRSPVDMRAELAKRMAAATDLETALDTLRRFRHEEFLRIGVHDIEGALAPHDVEQQLSDLAETCLEAALGIGRRETLARVGVPAEPPADALVVLGMGKLGGGELNYASDLDLIFIYEADPPEWWEGRLAPHELFTRITQRAISALQTPTREGIAYRIDTRLRPSGNQGPLVSSLEAFAAYHATSAQVWERQALIKASPLAGPAMLRAELERVVDRFVYGRGLARAEVEEIARMRERIERERGGGDEEMRIKTGRGGLVDVEFLVQMLQLRHGHAHPNVRVRSTRAAIVELARAGLLPADEAAALTAGWNFLRALENRMRLERNAPVEAIEADPEALLPLARRLGYAGADADAVAAFTADHARHRASIREIYERRFGEALG
jgi:glutamate-ammonia-ligase adenylyltransferase